MPSMTNFGLSAPSAGGSNAVSHARPSPSHTPRPRLLPGGYTGMARPTDDKQ